MNNVENTNVAVNANELFQETNIQNPTTEGVVETPQQLSQGEAQPSFDSLIAPKSDSQRVEYWQSKHDKLYNTVQELQNQFSAMQRGPVPEVNPVPQKPIKPNNYSDHDAITDPDSASAKYKSAASDYQEHMLNYYIERDNIREEEYQQVAVERENTEKRKQFVGGVYQNVVSRGATPEKAQKFIQWANSLESFSLDNIYAFYDFLQAKNNEQNTTKQTRLNVPQPIGVASGMSQQQTTEEDAFNLGFLRSKRP